MMYMEGANGQQLENAHKAAHGSLVYGRKMNSFLYSRKPNHYGGCSKRERAKA